MDDKLTVAIAQGTFSIIGTVLGIYLNNKIKLKDPDKIKQYLNTKEKVLEILEDLRLRTKADRSSIWLFSNGTRFYTGEHLQKISCYAESNTVNIEPILDSFQEVNINFFERTLFQLTKQDIIYSDETLYDDSLSIINKKYDINHVICVKLINKNKWTGVLVLGYKDKPSDINIIKALIELKLPQLNNLTYVK